MQLYSETPPNSEDVSDSRAGAGTDISKQSLRGGAYLAGRYGLGILISLGNMLVMTWWIGPHAYGIFVTAIGMIAFLATISRVGIDTYLVRSEAVPDSAMYGTATTLVLSASSILSLIAVALTPLLVGWYDSKEFVGPYLALLITIPVSGLAGVPTAKLERALEFRRVAGIELAGQAFGLAAAAGLAWSHAGVWAPVAGQIAWQSFILIATLTYSSLGLRLRFRKTMARDMLSFGIGLTVSLRTWQVRTLVNPLLIGRFLGAEAVAFVALAIRIAESLGTLRLAAGRMAIAALARLQHRREDFRYALEQGLYVQVVTLGPLLCGFALCGPVIVRHVIGVRWMPSLAIYPFVAAGVLVNSVYNLQASGLFVMGRQWVVTASYAAHVFLLAAATLVLLPRLGIVGYGWAELAACGAYWVIHSATGRSVAISYQKLVPWTAGFLASLFLIPVGYALLRMN